LALPSPRAGSHTGTVGPGVSRIVVVRVRMFRPGLFGSGVVADVLAVVVGADFRSGGSDWA